MKFEGKEAKDTPTSFFSFGLTLFFLLCLFISLLESDLSKNNKPAYSNQKSSEKIKPKKLINQIQAAPVEMALLSSAAEMYNPANYDTFVKLQAESSKQIELNDDNFELPPEAVGYPYYPIIQ